MPTQFDSRNLLGAVLARFEQEPASWRPNGGHDYENGCILVQIHRFARLAQSGHSARSWAVHFLAEAINEIGPTGRSGSHAVAAFNDAEGRTLAEVKAVLASAIAKAEAMPLRYAVVETEGGAAEIGLVVAEETYFTLQDAQEEFARRTAPDRLRKLGSRVTLVAPDGIVAEENTFRG